MRSPAAAFAWEIARRHRWGFVGLGLYVAALATLRLTLAGSGHSIVFPDEVSSALSTFVPMTAAVIYLLGVFSFGLTGNLADPGSLYPVRLFTLPVTSTALTAWPMLYGSAAMAALWLATRLLGLWSPELRVPLVWPALLGVVLLAWTQALTWMPYPLPGLRVLLSVFWLGLVGAGAVLGLQLEVPDVVMLAFLAPQLPVAFLVARTAVGRARRGERPDWSGLAPRLRERPASSARALRRFSSPDEAQRWLEWRRHGRSLPALVALALPFELWLLWVFPGTPAIVREVVLAALVTPPLMAVFAAANVSRSGPGGNDAWELTPFVAARPLTSRALVSARLASATASTLVAWLVVAFVLPLALWLSGTWGVVGGDARRLAEAVGPPRAALIALLGSAALVLSTWKKLVAGLYVGMSGRAWLVKASVFVTLVLLTVAVALSPRLLSDPGVFARVWEASLWTLAVLATAKLAALAWTAIRLRESGLVEHRTLIAGALSWDIAVLSLLALLLVLLPTLLFRGYGLGLVAILEVPLARISGLPLMAAWNRHR